MSSNIVFKGFGQDVKWLLLIGSLALVSMLIELLIWKITDYVMLSIYALLIIAGFSGAVCSRIPKRIVLSDSHLQYSCWGIKWIEIPWSNVCKIGCRFNEKGKGETLIYIETTRGNHLWTNMSDFSTETLKKIFESMTEIQKMYPVIKIEDNCEWLKNIK